MKVTFSVVLLVFLSGCCAVEPEERTLSAGEEKLRPGENEFLNKDRDGVKARNIQATEESDKDLKQMGTIVVLDCADCDNVKNGHERDKDYFNFNSLKDMDGPTKEENVFLEEESKHVENSTTPMPEDKTISQMTYNKEIQKRIDTGDVITENFKETTELHNTKQFEKKSLLTEIIKNKNHPPKGGSGGASIKVLQISDESVGNQNTQSSKTAQRRTFDMSSIWNILGFGKNNEESIYKITREIPVPVPYTVEKQIPVPVKVQVERPVITEIQKPYPVHVEKNVYYPVKEYIQAPYPVIKRVPYMVKIFVDKPIPVHVSKPYPVYIERKVPYAVEKHIPVPVKIPEDRPVPVHIPVVKNIYYPVEKQVHYTVPVHVDKPVPFPVEKPYPVYVEKEVPVPVEKHAPYPIAVENHKLEHFGSEQIRFAAEESSFKPVEELKAEDLISNPAGRYETAKHNGEFEPINAQLPLENYEQATFQKKNDEETLEVHEEKKLTASTMKMEATTYRPTNYKTNLKTSEVLIEFGKKIKKT